MVDMLDLAFVEHDAFALFEKMMEKAQSFYEVKDPVSRVAFSAASGRDESSAIVERSRYIHEVCLRKVDPELAAHLKNVEILPQIFLM
jgi:TBC1 domain family protein 5